MGGWRLLPLVRPTTHDGGVEGWLSDHVWVEAERIVHRVERGRRPTRKGMGGIASALRVAEAFARDEGVEATRVLQSEGRWPESIERIMEAVVDAHKQARLREERLHYGGGLVVGAGGVDQVVSPWRALLRACVRLLHDKGTVAFMERRQAIFHRGT